MGSQGKQETGRLLICRRHQVLFSLSCNWLLCRSFLPCTSPTTRWVTFHHPHCTETEGSLADARMSRLGGSRTNRATSPGQPAQPVLACSSARDLIGQFMPHVQASRAFSCSMNPVTPTLVPKPKFVHWPGCQGTHEARHLLFHCPFYNSTGKEPLGAVHTFGSGLQGQVPGQGSRPKRLPEGQVCKPKLSSLRLIH